MRLEPRDPGGSLKLLIMYSSLGLSGPEIMTEWLWLQGSHLRFIVSGTHIGNFLPFTFLLLGMKRTKKTHPI